MSAAATATTERSSDPNAFLPTFPGEDSLAHEGTQFMEDAKASMSAKGLMAVAEGEMPASALCIIDVSLDDLPKLPASHRDAARREEKRISVKAQNQANALKRELLTFEAWTQLFGALKTSTAAKAPVLSRTMADRRVRLGTARRQRRLF